ncbi:hypothetical protein DFH06DRAFT_1293368 [Mycena polygramma]|nr:hypothetical protein DFH06DRAFT_1293368 [Mycena polygramma]
MNRQCNAGNDRLMGPDGKPIKGHEYRAASSKLHTRALCLRQSTAHNPRQFNNNQSPLSANSTPEFSPVKSVTSDCRSGLSGEIVKSLKLPDIESANKIEVDDIVPSTWPPFRELPMGATVHRSGWRASEQKDTVTLRTGGDGASLAKQTGISLGHWRELRSWTTSSPIACLRRHPYILRGHNIARYARYVQRDTRRTWGRGASTSKRDDLEARRARHHAIRRTVHQARPRRTRGHAEALNCSVCGWWTIWMKRCMSSSHFAFPVLSVPRAQGSAKICWQMREEHKSGWMKVLASRNEIKLRCTVFEREEIQTLQQYEGATLGKPLLPPVGGFGSLDKLRKEFGGRDTRGRPALSVGLTLAVQLIFASSTVCGLFSEALPPFTAYSTIYVPFSSPGTQRFRSSYVSIKTPRFTRYDCRLHKPPSSFDRTSASHRMRATSRSVPSTAALRAMADVPPPCFASALPGLPNLSRAQALLLVCRIPDLLCTLLKAKVDHKPEGKEMVQSSLEGGSEGDEP